MLILPRTGTHYEVLGVAPSALREEIRQRWAMLIQRYHPDHFDRSDSWVSDQARRLIEAYQTLGIRNAAAGMMRAGMDRRAVTEHRQQGSIRQVRRKPWPRRRWVPRYS